MSISVANVGPDEFEPNFEDDAKYLEGIEWIIAWYELVGTEEVGGRGTAIYKRGDLYGYEDLGHYSYLGPDDSATWKTDMSASDLARMLLVDPYIGTPRLEQDCDFLMWQKLYKAFQLQQSRANEPALDLTVRPSADGNRFLRELQTRLAEKNIPFELAYNPLGELVAVLTEPRYRDETKPIFDITRAEVLG